MTKKKKKLIYEIFVFYSNYFYISNDNYEIYIKIILTLLYDYYEYLTIKKKYII